MNNVYQRAIKYLPTFFDNRLQVDAYGSGIFEPLKKIIDFDEAYIFFLNPDRISLKYVFSEAKRHSIDDVFPINKDIKNDLFLPQNMIFDSKNSLIKLLCVENNKSFLTSKLIIRETVYGFILLCKKEESYYGSEYIDISTAVGAAISYNIKDIELSGIFKTQLQALAESVVETKAAEKIKTEFLANISHELRTPLNAIIGFSEILSEKLFGNLNEKQEEYVHEIRVSGIHLLEMINEILDISKIEANAMSLNKSEFMISQATDEVINVLNPLLDKKSISLEKNITDGNVFADFQKIKQILYNLLSNAIKFSHDNGKIEVKVEFDKKMFMIEVKDFGIGIEPKNQKKIFEKFIQLENAYTKKESSTGLGLTITKELVEMHKGTISVESKINKGATFIVKIPTKPSTK